MFSNKEIASYYDLSEVHYRLFWDLENSHSLHYGYWDSSTRNFSQALLNINKILSQMARIQPGERILDAGCGVGGSSIWLVKEKSCRVTGISLSEKQVQRANLFAERSGVSSLANFECRDFRATGFSSESFDVVWAIESVCHADNKEDFLKEAFRLLKPGGRLIMADFFKMEKLVGEDARIIQQWAHGWAVPDFATLEDFEDQLQRTGFRELQISDATKAITPSARRLYRAYYIGWLGARLYKLFNPRATSAGKNNVDTALLQYKGLKKKLWSYQLVKAFK